jgi:hypothetical protein
MLYQVRSVQVKPKLPQARLREKWEQMLAEAIVRHSRDKRHVIVVIYSVPGERGKRPELLERELDGFSPDRVVASFLERARLFMEAAGMRRLALEERMQYGLPSHIYY